MDDLYDFDIVAWADKQTMLLRTGQLSALDIEHIADEIESVGKNEKHALASHFSVLLAHLLKWQLQPQRRGSSWRRTIKEQRKAIRLYLKGGPSLRVSLTDADWLALVWAHAVVKATDETGLDDIPEFCVWTAEQILRDDFWPN